MDSKFDWIAVKLMSSGSGKPFGEDGRVGAVVVLGVQMPDSVREIEVPVLIDCGEQMTITQARNAALDEARGVLRNLVGELDGQTYEQLAERQNRQDSEREERFKDELGSSLRRSPAEG